MKEYVALFEYYIIIDCSPTLDWVWCTLVQSFVIIG